MLPHGSPPIYDTPYLAFFAFFSSYNDVELELKLELKVDLKLALAFIKLRDKEGVKVDCDTHADTQDDTVRMNVKMEAMFECNAMFVTINYFEPQGKLISNCDCELF